MMHRSPTWIASVGFAGLGLAGLGLIWMEGQTAIAAPNGGNFRDTQGYWAQAFIQSLAERNIIEGYPDGTFRPNRPVSRDEFAAIVQKAFNQKPERTIAQASDYRDVPRGYWAAPAIKEAYEAGFLNGYPGGYFRPKQSISRAEALTALVNNLDLRRTTPTTTQLNLGSTQVNLGNTQGSQAQRPKRQIVLPLAVLSLLQPLKAVAAAVPQTAPPAQIKATKAQPLLEQKPQSIDLNSYYNDAKQIPQYATEKVAAATRTGLVVNYPNQKLLKPNQPATRAEVAAFIHQALVNQGSLSPIPDNANAAKFIVNRDRANDARASQ